MKNTITFNTKKGELAFTQFDELYSFARSWFDKGWKVIFKNGNELSEVTWYLAEKR